MRPARDASAVTTSRVVPGVDDTMDTSVLHNALNNEDLPAFGGPEMAMELPRRTASIMRDDASCFALDGEMRSSMNSACAVQKVFEKVESKRQTAHILMQLATSKDS